MKIPWWELHGPAIQKTTTTTKKHAYIQQYSTQSCVKVQWFHVVSVYLKAGGWRIQNKRLTNKHQGDGWPKSTWMAEACALSVGLRWPRASMAGNEEERECEAEESGDKLAPPSLTPLTWMTSECAWGLLWGAGHAPGPGLQSRREAEQRSALASVNKVEQQHVTTCKGFNHTRRLSLTFRGLRSAASHPPSQPYALFSCGLSSLRTTLEMGFSGSCFHFS